MTPRPLTPVQVRHLGLTERGPGETLQDYLVRHQGQMAGMIGVLKGDLDALYAQQANERARHRLHMIILANAQAGFAMMGYILLDWCGVSAHATATQMAVMIGLCALLGAFVSFALLAPPIAPRAWFGAARRQLDRLFDWLWPDEEAPAARRALIEVDPSRPETIDAAVGERAAMHLEMDTFFWRSRWLIAQVMVIVGAFSCAQIVRGVSLSGVIEDAALVALACLVAGGLFVLVADFINVSLARLGRWWRRR